MSTRPIRDLADSFVALKQTLTRAKRDLSPPPSTAGRPRRRRPVPSPAVGEFGYEAIGLGDAQREGQLLAKAQAASEAVPRQPPGKAAYWGYLGRPPLCGPGALGVAARYHDKILQTIDVGGWTRNERTALYRLEVVWRRRMTGADVRFALAGNLTRGGRLPRELERRVALLSDEGKGYA